MEKNLPPDVCNFIALAAQYRDAEKDYFVSRVSMPNLPASKRLEKMQAVINLGCQLDSALLTILPRPTDGK